MSDSPAMNDAPQPRVPFPRTPFLRFVAVALVSSLCGVAVAAGGGFLAAQVMEGRTTGIGDIVAVVVSMLAGFPLGVCAGLVVVRRVFRWPGSPVRGTIGAVLGAVFVMLAAEPLRLNADTGLLLVTYALCIAVFSTVGFVSRH